MQNVHALRQSILLRDTKCENVEAPHFFRRFFSQGRLVSTEELNDEGRDGLPDSSKLPIEVAAKTVLR